jgi:hypothetical protein
MAGKVVNSSLVLLSKFGQADKISLRKPPQVIYAKRCASFKLELI